MRSISASSTSRGRRYFGMPKCIMPPAIGPASWMTTAWPRQRQVPRGRQAARPGADDEHALARRRRVGRDRSSPCSSAMSPRNRSTAWMLTASSTSLRLHDVLARVIADAAVDGRHRVVADDDLPGLAVAAGLRLGEPGLHVLAGRAGVIARRQAIHVERAASCGLEACRWTRLEQLPRHTDRSPEFPRSVPCRGQSRCLRGKASRRLRTIPRALAPRRRGSARQTALAIGIVVAVSAVDIGDRGEHRNILDHRSVISGRSQS